MAKEPQDEPDDYEPADLGDDEPDEETRLRRAEEAEKREVRREILLGQIALARSRLDAAEAAGDAAQVAELERRIAELTRERNGL